MVEGNLYLVLSCGLVVLVDVVECLEETLALVIFGVFWGCWW